VFDVPIMTAIFAAISTFHNTLSGYLWALGRQSLVWSRTWRDRPIAKKPHAAARFNPLAFLDAELGIGVAGLHPSQEHGNDCRTGRYRRTVPISTTSS
jgi:hypothetical protein